MGTVGFAGGCGGGASGGSSSSLDCAYLAGDNCWKTTATAATSCLPASSEVGTLSADLSTCTFASGDVVTFSPALTLPLPDSPSWNFTVKTSAGTTCLAYQENSTGVFTLTVQGQTVKETTPGQLGIALSCPDGTAYSNSNGFSLLDCNDGGLLGGGLPGSTWSDTSSSVSFGLLATSTTSSDEQVVFNCETAATP
jgi:hypothetical protein